MSVLIKGMEKPTSGDDCPLAGDFNCNLMPSVPALCKKYDIAVQNGKRLNNCPLVFVPPHGRTIDADALAMSDRMVGKLMMFGGEYVYTQSEIDNAPTILEAEEGET